VTCLRVPYAELPVPPTEAFPDQTVRHYPVLKTWLEFQVVVLPFDFLSVIDSGADNCVFPAIYGRRLGIEIEAGKKYPYVGATGLGLAYFHKVKVLIEVEKKRYRFDCYCGFTDGLSDMGVGLLGRHGFFELFHSVKFIQNEKLVELEIRP
jgi:hypothetical protein